MKTDLHRRALSSNNEDLSRSSKAIRRCVHCGLCTATCPTYLLLMDERDSPRGRIYMIKNMLEEARPPKESEMKHIDRCLNCLGCTSTCPSGVDYETLINQGKKHIEAYRPWHQKVLRRLLVSVFSSGLFSKLLMAFAQFTLPISTRIPWISDYVKILPSWDLRPIAGNRSGVFKALSSQRGRVLLSRGCIQNAIGAQIHDRALHFLTHQGFEVIVPPITCCGSLELHASYNATSSIAKTIKQWQTIENQHGKCDAIINTSSGCTATMKNYETVAKRSSFYLQAQAYVKKVVDFTDFIETLSIRGKPIHTLENIRVAYHAPCSYQHGQQKGHHIPAFLEKMKAVVVKPEEAHICCGSAGTYNIFQPKIASELRNRKLNFIKKMQADILVTSNIGCMIQLSGGARGVPVCHISELLAFVWLGMPIHSCDALSSGNSDGIS